MNLLKYAAKLSKMSAHEIAFRLRQSGRNQVEQLRWRMGGAAADAGMFVPADIAAWDIARSPFPHPTLRFFGFAGDHQALAERYRSTCGDAATRTLREADALLGHHFTLLGLDVTLPEHIDWNSNPQTGQAYPLKHHSLIDTFNTGRYGDVKYVWELNRHQFFIEMAKAYFISGDERYADRLVQWLESYWSQVPYKMGINHTSVLEHAVRIYAWIWAYYFSAASSVWNASRRQQLVRQLLMEGQMIEENLSYYYSPYNHLIGELAALAFLGTVYPAGGRLKHWRDHYWQELTRQLGRQFHSDGFTVEQASYYHHFTTGFYLQLAILRQQNQLPVDETVWAMIEKALSFPMYLTRPDGQLPMIGDIDSARSIYFYRPEPMWNLRPFQSLGAVLFNRGDMKYVAREPGEELLWLLGEKGIEKYDALPAVAPSAQSIDFPTSGYFIMRDGWGAQSSYCCFDCGEIAHGVFRDETPSAAHGHADILSFDLSVKGKPLVIDPGFFTYFGAPEWHREFRGTSGHNGIEINGAGQAVHEGRIGWSHVSSPELEYWKSTPDFDLVGGRIDRFARLGAAVYHRRYLLFRKNAYFLCIDRLEGAASADSFDIAAAFHLSPGEATLAEQTLLRDGNQAMCFALPEAAQISVEQGGESADSGWVAVGYGQKTPAPVVRINMHCQLPLTMGMLAPISTAAESFQMKQLSDTACCFTILSGNIQEEIYFNPDRQSLTIAAGDQSPTNAVCTIVRSKQQQVGDIHYLR